MFAMGRGRTSTQAVRRQAIGPQAASRRAASVGPHSPASSREPPWGEHRPGVKGDGQGTRAVPGIGFARLRPARRRLCRQGVNSAAGPGEVITASRPTAPGQTFRAERRREAETQSPNGLRASRPALRPPFPHFPAAMPERASACAFSLPRSGEGGREATGWGIPKPGAAGAGLASPTRAPLRFAVPPHEGEGEPRPNKTIFENQEKATKISATTVMSTVRARMVSMAAVPNEA